MIVIPISMQKTIGWVVGNFIFGLAPLGLMAIISGLSSNKDADKEVHHLLNDGLPLFVSCAIMGGSMLDCLFSGKKLRTTYTIGLIITPLSVFAFLLLIYLLVVLKILNHDFLNSRSWVYYFVLCFAVAFIFFAKLSHYKTKSLT